jgi:chemotaxis protein histidine kinase CheA
MLVSEEQVAALEAEVAGLLGILEVLDEDGASEGIHRYVEQVERIGSMVGNAGFIGLRDVCLLLQEQLSNLDLRQQDIGDVVRERLEEWPILVIGYLSAPTDLQASESLIDHLRSSAWSVALSETEAAVLHSMLMYGAQTALDTVEPADEEWAGVAIEEPVPAPAIVSAEPVLMFQPSPAIAATEPLWTEPVPTEPFLAEVSVGAVSGQLTETVGETEVAAEVEGEVTTEAEPAELPESMAATVPAAIANITVETVVEAEAVALNETIADMEEEVETIADMEEEVETVADMEEEVETVADMEEEVETVADMEEEVETVAETEEMEFTDDDGEEEPAGVMARSGETHQELLDILCAEIAQIAETADEILALATAADSAPAARGEALSNYAEHLERLGDASDSIGLTGLQQVCASLQTNLSRLAAQDRPLDAEQRRVVEAWPGLALNYLQALGDPTACAVLVNHLQDAHWLQPLATADAVALTELLVAPKLVTETTEAEARPRQAQSADVSLALPADVNQELLDGLLHELPHQAAEFSVIIQRLATGDGHAKDVEVAQRIAHTLKGAGNTVGVRGIATLTHHIEDILQALSKRGALPNRALAETLLNAADCLEAMSEALLGISDPPLQALAVLQEVLDWANRIDRVGIPTDDEVTSRGVAGPEQRAELPETVTPMASPPLAASPPEATLRIPAHRVDDVLRLVGEGIILTGQIQERVRKTVAQTRAVMGQNRLFQQLTAELEQLVDIRNVSSPLSKSVQRGDFDPLELEQYNELNTVTHRLVEAATDARELSRAIEENLAVLDTLLVDQSRLHRDNQEAVLRTRMVPIQTVAPRLQRSVRQTCRLVDKEVELVVHGADTLMDSNVLSDMVDPLMHILRNAVDHGIELPARRKSLGKPPVGRIELSFGREGNTIAVRCQDDGAGLDLAAIRRTAIACGLLNADQSLADDELARLILLPGFSTRSETTQTSGRGVGMDMVYNRLLDMKGSLRIQTQTGKGCLMELRLPVTLISTHALLVHMGNQMVALSDRGIEQILYSGVGKIQELGKTTTFQIGSDVYELTSLDHLLNLPPDRRTRGHAASPVLLVREEMGVVRAVLVQEVLDSRDLVVKRLGQYLPKLNGVVGATILGDGSVVPVLDLPELLRAPAVSQPARTTTQVAAPVTPSLHRQFMLVVDDSLSARRSLTQFAQDAGYEVRTARDGLEAIEIINGKRPDLVLTDLEMPRMNGLELVAHLRASQITHDLPVIMITSRSTEKHRREAEMVGVNIYLTKPFMEDELLGQIHRLLRPT